MVCNRKNFILLFCLFIYLLIGVKSQNPSMNDLSGEDITGVMQTLGDKCPATTANGQNWAPLPKGAPCAGVPRCDFPNQWCAFKMGADGTPDLKSLNCQPLSAACTQSFKDLLGGGAGGGGSTMAGAGGITPAGAGGSTQGAGGASPAGPVGSSAAPGATTVATLGTLFPPMTSGPMGSTPGGGGLLGAMTTAQSSNAGSAMTMSGGAVTTAATSGMSSPGGMSSPAPMGGATTAASAGGGGGGSSSSPGPCCDYHEYCCFWAAIGECDANKSFMGPICKKSCGTCGCKGGTNSCPSNVDPTCSGPNVKPNTSVCPCKSGHKVDKDWNPKCSTWSVNGGCDKNPDYMKAMCKKSCMVCK